MLNSRTLLAALITFMVVAPTSAQRPRDQASVFKDAQRGKIMPLPRIEQQAKAHPTARGATYLGPEFNDADAVYRLKFMRGDRVVWIDLDARNGRVLRTSDD